MAKRKPYDLTKKQVHEILLKSDRYYAACAKDHAAGIPLNISMPKGNSKIGKALVFSTMCGRCCHNCAACIRGCYAMKIAYFRDGCNMAWTRNAYILDHEPEKIFLTMHDAMTRRRLHKYVRWHVSGEFQKVEELDIMFRLAKLHPDFQIWTYTKMWTLVNDYLESIGGKAAIPENLHIMYSQWGTDMVVDNPYGFPIYLTVLPGQQAPADYMHCPGNCDKCKAECNGCRNIGCIGGLNTWIEYHN